VGNTELSKKNVEQAISRSHIKVRFSQSGVLFFNRMSGINILLDEIQPHPSLWAKAPRQVSIALSNACDLSCPHCFAPKIPASLNPELLFTWLHELDENGCLGVGFGGGEPTLYRHFVELCSFTSSNTSLAVTFTTHGHHLSEKFLASLQGKVHFVRVSMDGVGKTYEKIRGRPFNVLLSHLKNLKHLVPFGINYLVNKYTLPDLNEAISIAESIGATEFLLLPEQPAMDRRGIDQESLQDLKRWIRLYKRTIPLTISDLGVDILPLCNPLPNERGIQEYAHIDATGSIKRTSYDFHGAMIGLDGVISALGKL
jgi:MoaA/NifB/PqqE/SkfB family radical SAM enzyme